MKNIIVVLTRDDIQTIISLCKDRNEDLMLKRMTTYMSSDEYAYVQNVNEQKKLEELAEKLDEYMYECNCRHCHHCH